LIEKKRKKKIENINCFGINMIVGHTIPLDIMLMISDYCNNALSLLTVNKAFNNRYTPRIRYE
jgi:hypothetical protein